jgi:hypothetical protein
MGGIFLSKRPCIGPAAGKRFRSKHIDFGQRIMPHSCPRNLNDTIVDGIVGGHRARRSKDDGPN